MEKWDELTVILRDNKLDHLLDAIYEQSEQDNFMTDTILNVAEKWKINNPDHTNDIIDHLVINIRKNT